MSSFWQAVAEAMENQAGRLKGINEYWERETIWSKGRIVPGLDPNEWRQDAFGSRIRKSDYGNCLTVYGWEIDHIIPLERGGSDTLGNKQPLQWANNRRKGDKLPAFASALRKISR